MLRYNDMQNVWDLTNCTIYFYGMHTLVLDNVY